MANQFATFFLDGHYFGVDVLQVQEVIRFQAMTAVPLAPATVAGLINLRGQIVTALDLRTRVGLPSRSEGERPMNVVVRTDDGSFSLLVDEIGDVVEVDSRRFEPVPPTVDERTAELVTGVYKLDDRLLLVVDVERALQVEE